MHRHNRLNDLTNRQWLQETKSFWHAQGDGKSLWTPEVRQELCEWLRETYGDEQAERLLQQLAPGSMYSVAPPREKLKLLHPATFSERDIERLIRLFTKEGQSVLDPFVGTGSTLLACHSTGRRGIGIELVDEWMQITRQRLADAGAAEEQTVLAGDAREKLDEIGAESVGFVVTSPPYWSILGRDAGMKAQAERVARKLPTKYSEEAGDLGNLQDYDTFLASLGEVFAKCETVLRPTGYLACIVSDFRHGPKFHMYHADIARVIEEQGLPLKGITVLLQDSKNLYPFAIPYAFVSNIHHQYILVHQKPKAK